MTALFCWILPSYQIAKHSIQKPTPLPSDVGEVVANVHLQVTAPVGFRVRDRVRFQGWQQCRLMLSDRIPYYS